MAGPSVGLSQDTSLKEGGGAGCSIPLANGSPPLGRLTHTLPSTGGGEDAMPRLREVGRGWG